MVCEGTARLADLTLFLATGEAGGMEREGDLLLRPPGEDRGVGPRDIDTPSQSLNVKFKVEIVNTGR